MRERILDAAEACLRRDGIRRTTVAAVAAEADISRANKFRDELCSTPWTIGADGHVRPNEAPGIGVEVDEGFLAAHPAIEGPGYV